MNRRPGIIPAPVDAEAWIDNHYADMQHKLDEAITDLMLLVESKSTSLSDDRHDIGAALDLDAVSSALTVVIDVYNELGNRHETEERYRAAWPHIVARLEAEEAEEEAESPELPVRWVIDDDGTWTDEADQQGGEES